MVSVSDLLILSQIPGIGANRVRTLVSHFGSPTAVLEAPVRAITEVEGFSKKLAYAIVQFVKSDPFEVAKEYAARQLSRMNRSEGHIVTFWDKQYPDALKKIYDPPPFFFYKGEICEADKYSIAIVGTRSPSEYGIGMTERFCQELSRLGITIVSGLARGIDTVAHSTALKTNGRTLAVIGSGIDVIYPPENKPLSERIIKNGAVISEYVMGAKPDAANFPKRNRIISGLTLGTVIIETDVNGGAMITANMALDQNREVFALPGPVISKRSRGCNVLIKEGRAKLIESTDDILQELSGRLRHLLKKSEKEDKTHLPEMNFFERSIYDVITDDPIHIDAITEKAGMSTADVLVNLLSLEFKGIVKQLPGKMFLRQ
jgi:DNA processing protein